MNQEKLISRLRNAAAYHSKNPERDLRIAASRMLDIWPTHEGVNIGLLDTMLTICDRALRRGMDFAAIDQCLQIVRSPKVSRIAVAA